MEGLTERRCDLSNILQCHLTVTVLAASWRLGLRMGGWGQWKEGDLWTQEGALEERDAQIQDTFADGILCCPLPPPNPPRVFGKAILKKRMRGRIQTQGCRP